MTSPRHDHDDLPSSSGLRTRRIAAADRMEWTRLDWSHDGTRLAALGQDLTFRAWTAGGDVAEAGRQSVRAFGWSPTHPDRYLAMFADRICLQRLGADAPLWTYYNDQVAPRYVMAVAPLTGVVAVALAGGSVIMLDAATGHYRRAIPASRYADAVAWSPSGDRLLICDYEGTGHVQAASFREDRFEGRRPRCETLAGSVAWSPDATQVAVASAEVITIRGAGTLAPLVQLEGHTAPVTCVAFSADGRLLASESDDGELRLWRTDDWQCAAIVERGPGGEEPAGGLAFHPREQLLAFRADRNRNLCVLEIDTDRLCATVTAGTSRYANAKVVLLGDTGVGKSGLALVLSGQPYRATDSTHGRQVRLFSEEAVPVPGGGTENREVLLWDLAGRPGYRLVHQLHLADAAVALIVFDARSEVDPFAGVRYWARALRHGRRRPRALLVAARGDRGGPSVSRARIEALAEELRLDGYFETSARWDQGIARLTDAITRAIDWEAEPRSISTTLFETIKRFLVSERSADRALSTGDDLYRLLRARHPALSGTPELRAGFDTCVGLLESRDLVRRFTFGGYVLLRPELLDAYASALVNAARDQPDGLGFISEEEALRGRYAVSGDVRLDSTEEERLLMIATIEELLQHELALREPTERGADLVFPSQLTRDRPEAPHVGPVGVTFLFEGAIQNVYATLAVRLAHATTFTLREMWQGAAVYATRAGGRCGLSLTQTGDGRGGLELSYSPETAEETRLIFEDYVADHLARRALPETVVRRRVFSCPDPECAYELDARVTGRRRARGHTEMRCPACDDALISLIDRRPMPTGHEVSAMNDSADRRRRRDTATVTVRGKRAVGDYDVFLAYLPADRPAVEDVHRALLDEGLLPWLDVEEVTGDGPLPAAATARLAAIDTVVVLVGPAGGPWDDARQHALINRFIGQRARFVPVLLPGAGPGERPAFLAGLPEFDLRVIEPDAAARLARRIAPGPGSPGSSYPRRRG